MVLKNIFPIVLSLVSCSRISVTLYPAPDPLEDDACLVSALASGNNQIVEREFLLGEESNLQIVAQGEGTSFNMNPQLVCSFFNDCVEVFVDVGTVRRQYHFIWDASVVMGNNVDLTGVQFAQGDPSMTSYLFEMSFPWSTLGLDVIPTDSTPLWIDVSVMDNDDLTRDSQISWGRTTSDLGNGLELYNLSGSRTSTPPHVDGKIDELWNNVSPVSISNVIFGTVRDNSDIDACFRLLFDEDNLYLLVEVYDDIKKQSSYMFDTGWITDRKGNIVWEMKFDRTFHAGGALKNRRQEDTLTLSPGRYTLHFTTDESHAYGQWDDLPPNDPFSGLKINLIKQKTRK